MDEYKVTDFDSGDDYDKGSITTTKSIIVPIQQEKVEYDTQKLIDTIVSKLKGFPERYK
jgi:hypothetical protein